MHQSSRMITVILCSGDRFGIIISLALMGNMDNMVIFCRPLIIVPRRAYYDGDIQMDILNFMHEVEGDNTIFAVGYTDQLRKCSLIDYRDIQYVIAAPMFGY